MVEDGANECLIGSTIRAKLLKVAHQLRRRDMTGTPVGTRRKLRSRDRIGTARPSGTGQHDQTPGGHARAHESCHEAKDGGMSPTRGTGRSIVRTDTMRVPSLTRREGMRFADKSLNCN